MKTKKRYHITGLTLLLLVLFSCKKEFDKDAPLAVFNTNQLEFTLFSGDSLVLPVHLLDSTGLSQYRIFSQLSPSGVTIDSTRSGDAFMLWKYLYIGDLEGSEANFLVTIKTVESNPMPGPYYLILNATDLDYNLGADTILIYLKQKIDTVPPQLQMLSPMPGDIFNTGDTMTVEAYVPDFNSSGNPSGIWQASVQLIPGFTGPSPLLLGTASGIKSDYIQVLPFVWDATHDPGTYFLRFILRDQYNNVDSMDVMIGKN